MSRDERPAIAPNAAQWQATCVAIGARGVLIEGVSGIGKSSLALALIDRGARLVGDDGVLLWSENGPLWAGPVRAIAGKIEVRNLGILEMPALSAVPIALVIVLDHAAPRFITGPESAVRAGQALPLIRLWPDSPQLALRAELALTHYGLDAASGVH